MGGYREPRKVTTDASDLRLCRQSNEIEEVGSQRDSRIRGLLLFLDLITGHEL
jgi:hypothetical protein